MTFAPMLSTWSRCCSMPGRSPPYHSREVFLPRPSGSWSHGRGTAHSGGWYWRRVLGAARGEPVGVDLIDDRGRMPCGSSRIEQEREIVAARDLRARDPAPV